jgi:hypothetical protein
MIAQPLILLLIHVEFPMTISVRYSVTTSVYVYTVVMGTAGVVVTLTVVCCKDVISGVVVGTVVCCNDVVSGVVVGTGIDMLMKQRPGSTLPHDICSQRHPVSGLPGVLSSSAATKQYTTV